MDMEWRPKLGSMDTTQLSIIQIAVWDTIYLIDVLKLLPLKDQWKEFSSKIFNSSLLVLGYGIQNDLKNFKSSFPFLTNFKPYRVLDLASFTDCFFVQYPEIIASKTEVTSLKGLSKLSYLLLDKTINKNEQFSDWERRPLRAVSP